MSRRPAPGPEPPASVGRICYYVLNRATRPSEEAEKQNVPFSLPQDKALPSGIRLMYQDDSDFKLPGVSSHLYVTNLGKYVATRHDSDSGIKLFTLYKDHWVPAAVPQRAARANGAAFSSDGKLLLTSHAERFAFSGLESPDEGDWHVVSESPKNDVLARVGPADLAVARNGTWLFLLGSWPGQVAILHRDASSGELKLNDLFQESKEELAKSFGGNLPPSVTFLEGAKTLPRLGRPVTVRLSPDDRFAYVACNIGSLKAFALNAENTHWKPMFELTGPPLKYWIFDSTCLSISPSGKDLVVGTMNNISWFKRDSEDGKLTLLGVWRDTLDGALAGLGTDVHDAVGLARCSGLAFSSNGKYLFIASAGRKQVTVADVSGDTLKIVGAIQTYAKGSRDPALKAFGVGVSPDGKYLFSTYDACRLVVHELDERYHAK